MMKPIYLLITFFFICSFLSACSFRDNSPTADEGFAIYLTRDDIPPERMEMLSHIEITDEPIISIDDIVTYDALTHRIELTSEAFERVSLLEVPVSGKSFLVCLDKSPVYWGAFWVMYSSLSFEGITMMRPLVEESGAIKIGLGYPTPGFFGGEDSRGNTDIMKTLRDSGKLVNEMSFTFIDELPHSMKGYELYSWREGDEWYFKLITGTNRTKTLQEIVRKSDEISDLVDIRVTGVDALLTLLHKLPDGESVFWGTGSRVGDTTGSDVVLELPDEITRDFIIDYAEKSGIELIPESPNN
ncbi:MAG: hypothetical protein JW762_13280 [Dehalococcoidales bacterium]|nr:hypothetical protein [Dehalococcoidales bacterium]